MKNHAKQSTQTHGFLPYELSQYRNDFCCRMRNEGFTDLSTNGYAVAIAHLGTWLHNHSIKPEQIDSKILIRFSRHKCTCLGYTYTQPLSSRYIKRIEKFVAYLRTRNIIPALPEELRQERSRWDQEAFSQWLSRERGLAPITVKNYLRGVDCALSLIGHETRELLR